MPTMYASWILRVLILENDLVLCVRQGGGPLHVGVTQFLDMLQLLH